jgi:hypothetical protein
MILEENWNIQEKRSGMKRLWKRFRLHFTIPTRQRDEKIQINSRKIWKSTTSGKISGEKYQIP